MEGITCTPLKRIKHPKGDLSHALKKSEASFDGFGEAYFTSIEYGKVKGWKKHLKMTLNLIVPIGKVIFYIYDEKTKVTERILIDSSNYCRLTISPGLWVAFEGGEESLNLILNIASIEHDPLESINEDLNKYPMG